jgi:pimeloyl-ACP methyl ester carboxylesterase
MLGFVPGIATVARKLPPVRMTWTRFAARAFIAGLVLASCAVSANGLPESPLEKTVCGGLAERLAFWSWSRGTGRPNSAAIAHFPGTQAVTHLTSDGRTLGGFHMPHEGTSKGTILFAQGNGMRADEILDLLKFLTEHGFDVYVFDFRGFASSNGTARLLAIVSDYGELVDKLAAETPALFLYGISFGGVILANIAGSHSTQVKALAIDSSPSQLSNFGCPARYDAIANIPKSASNVLVVSGALDKLVSPEMSRALISEVVARGGKSKVFEKLGHPFMDGDSNDAVDRLKVVTDFFEAEIIREEHHDK